MKTEPNMRSYIAADVRFGSKADTCSAKRHVRFTLNSGHVRCKEGCPLSANSGHALTYINITVGTTLYVQ
jgi:hypothetical protein